MKEKLTFREAQLGAYDVLKFIDKVCSEQGFTYFLAYGSMLGAVRNGGIIPWDDDIDVIMPRPDYDRLIEYCRKYEAELTPFKLFEKSLVPTYPHPIARMSSQNYWIDFANEQDYGIGLFVDIYPLEGVGNDLEAARKRIPHFSHLSSLCFLTSRKKFGTDNTHSRLKMLLKVPAFIWANIWGNSHYIQKIDTLCKKYSFEESRYVSVLAQPWHQYGKENKNIHERSWYEPVRMQFEDREFPVPKGYDEILKMGYGDYMTLPPENQRQTHHTYDTYRIK